MISKGNKMIKIENLSFSFPQKDLFNKISFTLEKGQHCAFIGISGSGKSTLTDLIMEPDNYMFEGEVGIDPDCRIGYVSQFYTLDQTNKLTVFEYIGGECIRLQNELAAICSELETASDTLPLLEKYQDTLDALDSIGGDDFESEINKKLNLANLMKQRDLAICDLSGGEFKLIQIIKEMLTNPDLLIMDEPDVFLDFDNLNALKNLINDHKGTILVITHSRFLLNLCFNKIIHLENMELQEFDGSYIDYNLSLLESKIELQELAQADTDEIARHEVVVDNFRTIATNNADASRGKSLKARVRLLERLEARRIKAPFVYIMKPNICLMTDNVSEGTIALQVNNYNLAFDEILLENVKFEIQSTDKVALIGPNGTGKTTLLREIFKNNHESIRVHEDVKMAYLSQLQGEMLNDDNTPLEEFFQCGFETSNTIADYLSGYGFSTETINQKIKSLSGGEKNILQLAKISSSNANMLLLDEPTSHLDTYSQIALEEAIVNYRGGILMVSHDFYSIVNCMDYVLLIEDKSIRKVQMRKFKRMIYAKYFDRDYLEFEEKKKSLETGIELALEGNNFIKAQNLSLDLRNLITMA